MHISNLGKTLCVADGVKTKQIFLWMQYSREAKNQKSFIDIVFQQKKENRYTRH